MGNPWLQIPLTDYEGHMSLPYVAQADLLADLFGLALQRHLPDSVAVLGCAGGPRGDLGGVPRAVGPTLTNPKNCPTIGVHLSIQSSLANPSCFAAIRGDDLCFPLAVTAASPP